MNALMAFFKWVDLDFWEAMLVALMVGGLTLIWKASRAKNNPFDFTEIMQDEATNKTSFKKLAGLVALIATTWGFLRMVAYHQMPDWYAQLYFLTWALVLMVPGLANMAGEVLKAWALRTLPAAPPAPVEEQRMATATLTTVSATASTGPNASASGGASAGGSL